MEVCRCFHLGTALTGKDTLKGRVLLQSHSENIHTDMECLLKDSAVGTLTVQHQTDGRYLSRNENRVLMHRERERGAGGVNILPLEKMTLVPEFLSFGVRTCPTSPCYV